MHENGSAEVIAALAAVCASALRREHPEFRVEGFG